MFLLPLIPGQYSNATIGLAGSGNGNISALYRN
jgi:hypothetical protein